MDIVLGVIIGAFVSVLTKIVGDLLLPGARKHRSLVVSLFLGLVALSAFIAWRSSMDNPTVTPIAAPVNPTPYSGNTIAVQVTEGDKQHVVLGTDEIIVSVMGKGTGGIGLLDDLVPLETITATTPTETKSEKMRVGDCLVVRPFTVTMHDVRTANADRVTLVVAKLSSDADVTTCKIAPTPTTSSP